MGSKGEGLCEEQGGLWGVAALLTSGFSSLLWVGLFVCFLSQRTEMLLDGECYINANFVHFCLPSAGAQVNRSSQAGGSGAMRARGDE